MSLAAGTRLGPCAVTGSLGAGGMGEVYSARDTRLDRTVAIKVLPADKVAAPERRRRFVQEARAASALNHPHIITVHDTTQGEGLDVIVMEYVEGKTLDALIPRAGMRLSEVLKIGVHIAQALAAAHAKGIVHRDLKPANVMVAQDGTIKVLDFGLAKLNEPAAGASESQLPTGEARTDAGVVLGTAAYMSPEQGEGKPVDARSDVFSFGAVLYEMATGRPAFAGDSWASTVAAVLAQEPKPLEGLPHDLEKTTLRCLRKDPAKRFQHMDDVSVALQEPKEESDSGRLGAAATTVLRRPLTRTLAYLAAVAGVLLAADGGPPRRVTNDPATDCVPTWSRDGRSIYFTSDRSGARQLWKVPAEGGTPVQVTRDGGVNAFESEDGRTLYYVKDIEAAGLWKMPISGGEEVRVLDAPEPRRWGAVAYVLGGVYYSARERAGGRASPWAIFFHEFKSGKTERIARIDKPLGFFARALAVSPDRRWLLFNQVDTPGSDLMLLEHFR